MCGLGGVLSHRPPGAWEHTDGGSDRRRPECLERLVCVSVCVPDLSSDRH